MHFLLEPLLDEQALQAFRSALLQSEDHWQSGAVKVNEHRVFDRNSNFFKNWIVHVNGGTKNVSSMPTERMRALWQESGFHKMHA